jgi:uroporphyrinogen decarboxylase
MILPNFNRFRQVLLRQGEPDYVPLVEVGVDLGIQERFLGRPSLTVEDEVEFYFKAGYDHYPVHLGLQSTRMIRDLTMHELEAGYAVDPTEKRTRYWATEGKGLIRTRADLDAFKWPNPDELDYSVFEKAKAALPPNVKVTADIGKIFTCVWWLMGLEGLSLSLLEEPDLVTRLFQKVGQFQFRVFENMLRFDCIGAFWHADDIAFSTQLLVNPKIYRACLFPWYKEMNRIAHGNGLPVVYHSDGALQEVMEDIIDCGFDGLNPIEPKAMDINEIKKKYGSRISLIGNIDLGYTLTLGTPDEVREEVRRRIRDVAPGGGYAVASSNSIPEYVPYDNYMALREATFKYGRYPISC